MSAHLVDTPPIAVTILSGFLGSGKTTLLNRLLRASHGRKLAVIVNEFGAVGIDGALVPQGEQFVEMDNGCLCCALNEDLVATLTALTLRGGIDHIVIETTGLADPLPVAWSCTRPGLGGALRVDAIVTVVDVASIDAALSQSREARMQVQRADVLVFNKCDLVADGAKSAQARVQELNGHAPVLFAQQGDVPWPLILGEGRGEGQAREPEFQPPRGPHLAPTKGHQHPQSYATLSLAMPATQAVDEAQMEALSYRIPEDVFRFKALLKVDSDEGPWLLINGVAGRIDLRFLQPSRVPTVNAWVFIGRDLDSSALKSLVAEAFGVAPHQLQVIV